MKTRYYLPSGVQCPDHLSADEKARLERAILDALRRGIAGAAGEMPEIVIAELKLPENAREAFSSSRYHDERGTYAVPSYQEGGAQVEIPLEPLSFEETVEGDLQQEPLDVAQKAPPVNFDVIRWKRRSIPAHLKAGILTRAPIQLPAEKIGWLLDVAAQEGVRWVKRLAIAPSQVLAKADVTIELFRVQDPALSDQELSGVFEKYLEQRHQQELANTKFFAGRWFYAKDRSYFEAALGLSFDSLFHEIGLPLPERMTSSERRRHALLIYAGFPAELEFFMVPESVIDVDDAIEAALRQEPIGRLDEILRNADQFKDKLEGADDKLVVVLVGEAGHEERRVVSLGVLRESIRKTQSARQNPVLFGYFERQPSAEISADIGQEASRARFFLASLVGPFDISRDRVGFVRREWWEFEIIDKYALGLLDYERHGSGRGRSEILSFAPEDPVALHIGGGNLEQAKAKKELTEVMIPALGIQEVALQVIDIWKGQVGVEALFKELEHLTEALTIYFAIGTAGRLAGAGRVSLATFRQAGVRAAAAQAGKALLTRAGLVLAGETVLDLVLPTLVLYIAINKEELKKTPAGQSFIRAVDDANTALAVFGLSAIVTLGALRLLRARIQRVKLLKQTEESAKMFPQMESEVDDLLRQGHRAVSSKTLQVNMPALIRSRLKERIAEQLKKLKHRVAFDEPEKMKEVIRELSSVDTPANKKLRELLKPVWEGLHDPDLVADVVTDVWWQSSKFSKAEAAEWGLSELTLGAIDLALKETGGTVEVLTSQLSARDFLKDYVAQKLFLDWGAGKGHGWTSHLIQDIVVDRVLKRIDPGLNAIEFRKLIAQTEGAKSSYRLRVTNEEAPLGALIFEQLFDESTRYNELINEPEALIKVLRELEELKTLE